MDIVIRYHDIERWKKVGKRVLVYGRRKTGNSFFIKNFTNYDEYFFVKRDRGIIDIKNNREISYDYLKDLILREKDKRIVIDEFHRLPEDFLDFLHAYGENLNLILISSTLWFSKKLLSKSSPILGIFEEFKIDLINEIDILKNLMNEEGKEFIEKGIYLREPWIIPLVKDNIVDSLVKILKEQKYTISNLIGEIFLEEDKIFKETYYTILTAIASDKAKSSEISSFLFNRKIIEKDDPSIIQSYLKTLEEIGLIEKIKILNKNYYQYKIISPLLDLYFYLIGKYGYTEIDINDEEIKRVINEKISYHVEDFFRKLLSQIYGLKYGKITEKDFEVDIVLYSFNDIKVVGEVKWKNNIDKDEIKRIENNLNKFNCRKILIVPDKNNLEYIPENIEIIDTNKIKEIIKNYNFSTEF
ncbi:MAG: hypothetical protein ACP5G1_04630 [Nanopusillaceae archaeon]